MGIFSRITEIANANINALLDKAEEPEKMVKLMIHEMEDTLTEVKSAAAEVVADRIRLNRLLEAQVSKRGDWEGKAQLALEKGREDLAKEALEQKIECQKKIPHLKHQLAETEELAKQYQNDISKLEEKLESAISRQKTLIANHQSAVNRKRIEEKIYKLNTHGAFARFENFEQRIDRFQAESEIAMRSNDSLEKKFDSLLHNQDVEDELQSLKQKLGKSTTPKEVSEKPPKDQTVR